VERQKVCARTVIRVCHRGHVPCSDILVEVCPTHRVAGWPNAKHCAPPSHTHTTGLSPPTVHNARGPTEDKNHATTVGLIPSRVNVRGNARKLVSVTCDVSQVSGRPYVTSDPQSPEGLIARQSFILFWSGELSVPGGTQKRLGWESLRTGDST
jgi:hypothetical protein